MPRAFDYTQKDVVIPMRYNNTASMTKPTINGTWVDYGSVSSSEVKYPYCDIEQTNGMLLTSGSQFMNNISCNPHSYNAGNYYNFLATSAGMPSPTVRSICPRGWYLPNDIEGAMNYQYFVNFYNIRSISASNTNLQTPLLNMPFSFISSGRYTDNKTGSRTNYGFYRSASSVLFFNNTALSAKFSDAPAEGYPVRCVSR